MLRLLPFRQYDEQDVVNLFALESDLALAASTDDGQGSNGVFVKVTNGNFDQDVVEYTSNSYLGKTDYPHVGANLYPTNPLTVSGVQAGDAPLGITLNQTAKADENGEKLLYNKTKCEELQAVLPGQTVPVATKGIFTLATEAFSGAASDYAVGTGIVASADGTVEPGAPAGAFGTVIGTGSRTSNGNTDLFAGDYLIVKLG